MAALRARRGEDTALQTSREEARRLAGSVLELTGQMEANHAALAKHVGELAPGLTEAHGVGPVTAASVLVAYSQRGRVRSEAAFAALAGAAPLQASSGNTVSHRLNRGGDRQLNSALEVIARVRMSNHPETRAYVERRLAEGISKREIRRCLKRYIARQLFRSLNGGGRPGCQSRNVLAPLTDASSIRLRPWPGDAASDRGGTLRPHNELAQLTVQRRGGHSFASAVRYRPCGAAPRGSADAQGTGGQQQVKHTRSRRLSHRQLHRGNLPAIPVGLEKQRAGGFPGGLIRAGWRQRTESPKEYLRPSLRGPWPG